MNKGIFTEEEQQYLFKKKVLLIGLGGIGSKVADMLARLGIGELGLCDFDMYDVTNINRQLYATYQTIDQYKVDVIEEQLSLINPGMKLHKYYERIEDYNKLIFQYDYVIDAVDNIVTKIFILDEASKYNKFVVHGACGGWYAQVAVISPGNQLLHEVYKEKRKGLEEQLLNNSFITSNVASIMVSEFIKLALHKETVLDELILIDLYNASILHTGGTNG